MYENLHDFEILFHEGRLEMEKNMEISRKLKACRTGKEIKKHFYRLLMLLTFRNINK
ncbi:hypothetical protein [Oceanispirochaeta sp.]|jgi:hypothetical protein|uniref:hypothetical protein n=1 Tax=Oceanispirochaeta sp. TaxID=2035350 RepID=UPI00263940EC|nr:hypothetical protein [Oceanispirochaeta sp.]MDA3956039.1 hypothetical protein [Oceanispirochaeta sp.]